MKTPRISRQTLRVLENFLERPTVWRYGYELSRETGLKFTVEMTRRGKSGNSEGKFFNPPTWFPDERILSLTVIRAYNISSELDFSEL
jgi:hypothetical protein